MMRLADWSPTYLAREYVGDPSSGQGEARILSGNVGLHRMQRLDDFPHARYNSLLMISVVIPVRNEEQNVAPLHAKLTAALAALGEPFEIIFSDNASTDGTVAALRALPRVKVLLLARDFGQTSNLDAAIHESRGDVVITMDGDQQNDPSDIPRLIAKIREGYDAVSGWRQDRRDAPSRRALSRLANWLTARISGLALHDSACALKAYRGELLRSVHLYGEMHVFLPALLYLRGARVAEIPVRHHERVHGISKHYFMKAVKDIADLLTIKFIAGIGGRPLVFFGGVGVLSALLGAISAGVAIYLKFAGMRNFGQTPLPILTVFFFIAGLILFMLGFLAELLVRVYYETTNRTPYVIREKFENH